jgi:hypothetical protein
MEVIKLNKRQFEWFNDCECNMVSENINSKYYNKNESEFFNYEHFIPESNNDLFDIYDYIIVTSSDEIYGIKGYEKTFLKRIKCAFNCARLIK